MAEPIETAGMAEPAPSSGNPRRDAIKAIRQILKRNDATEDELDDALEALVELAKD